MLSAINARKNPGKPYRVVLCESFDQRLLRAAHLLTRNKQCQVILLGNYDDLEAAAAGYSISLAGMEVIDCYKNDMQSSIASSLSGLVSKSGFDPKDPVVAGAWLVKNGLADAIIAGAAANPAHVMRIYLRILSTAAGCKSMSGMSLILFNNCDFVESRVVGLADVSVIPEPDENQLSDIALQSAINYERITGEKAVVAFLSFSSKGSSNHVSIEKIRKALEKTAQKKPDLVMEGEIQLDAALIPAMAGTKIPSSTVAGKANVLVFPNLSAGNIAVKIFENFSTYHVVGPILQGLQYPATYIPRGSSAEDVVEQIQLLIKR